MIGKDELARACSDNDALVEEHEDFPNFWRERGVDSNGLGYVAMQRGLRAVLISKGINPNSPRPYTVSLNARERQLQVAFAAAFMDGFAVGRTVVDTEPED